MLLSIPLILGLIDINYFVLRVQGWMRSLRLLLSERADGLCWALLLTLMPTQTHDNNLISYELSRVLNCLPIAGKAK